MNNATVPSSRTVVIASPAPCALGVFKKAATASPLSKIPMYNHCFPNSSRPSRRRCSRMVATSCSFRAAASCSEITSLIVNSPLLYSLCLLSPLPPEGNWPSQGSAVALRFPLSLPLTQALTGLFTQVRGIRILRSPDAGSWIKPRNTPPRWPWPGPIHARGARYYRGLDAYASIWMLGPGLRLCWLGRDPDLTLPGAGCIHNVVLLAFQFFAAPLVCVAQQHIRR